MIKLKMYQPPPPPKKCKTTIINCMYLQVLLVTVSGANYQGLFTSYIECETVFKKNQQLINNQNVILEHVCIYV